MITDHLPALLSVPRAAQILGVSRASAYRYAASGDLPAKRLGTAVSRSDRGCLAV